MAQLNPLRGRGNRLSPEELGLLAKELAAAPDPIEAARIKERLTRGFYGADASALHEPLRNQHRQEERRNPDENTKRTARVR